MANKATVNNNYEDEVYFQLSLDNQRVRFVPVESFAGKVTEQGVYNFLTTKAIVGVTAPRTSGKNAGKLGFTVSGTGENRISVVGFINFYQSPACATSTPTEIDAEKGKLEMLLKKMKREDLTTPYTDEQNDEFADELGLAA